MNYGGFLRRLRSFCINKSIKNEDLVNEPIEDLVDFAHLKKEKGSFKGEKLHYEATEASRIVNNKLDIAKIRDAMRRDGAEEVIIDSFARFYEDNIDKHLIGDMVDDFLNAIEADSCFKKKEITYIKRSTNEP